MAKYIDLSYPLEQGQLNFPSDPQIRVRVHNTVPGCGYNITELSLSTHHGTHLDVPYHFFDDGKTLDQMPLEKFFGPATLVDLAPGSYLEAKTPLTVRMFEPNAERFQPGAKVLFRTGWERMFGKSEFFSDIPTLTPEAAQWIADRKIGLLGMDMPTPSADWKEVHWILLKKGLEIVIVEGLANLDKLPPWFTLSAFPLNIKGRDGSPVRAVAIVED